MSLIGHHTLNPTADPAELATREACATEGHQPLTYNPWHDGTWCRCGALVVAGDHAPIPTPTPKRSAVVELVGDADEAGVQTFIAYRFTGDQTVAGGTTVRANLAEWVAAAEREGWTVRRRGLV